LYQEIMPNLEHIGLGDLHAQDLQNCLCEYDKYARVRSKEGKPRRRFVPRAAVEPAIDIATEPAIDVATAPSIDAAITPVMTAEPIEIKPVCMGAPQVGEVPGAPPPKPNGADPKTSIDFLQSLHPAPWTLIAIDPDKPGPVGCAARTADEARAFVAKHNGKRNLYYAVNPLRAAMDKKPKKVDVAAIAFLSVTSTLAMMNRRSKRSSGTSKHSRMSPRQAL
jgi:hypothetical protein